MIREVPVRATVNTFFFFFNLDQLPEAPSLPGTAFLPLFTALGTAPGTAPGAAPGAALGVALGTYGSFLRSGAAPTYQLFSNHKLVDNRCVIINIYQLEMNGSSKHTYIISPTIALPLIHR